jgi:hypothetical protein
VSDVGTTSVFRTSSGNSEFAAEQRPGLHCCSADALLELLFASIERGHWRVALRRYLMLLVCDAAVPPRYEVECRRYVARCPAPALRKIRADVHQWAEMISAPSVERIHFQIGSGAPVPRDKFDLLHSVFRPLPEAGA